MVSVGMTTPLTMTIRSNRFTHQVVVPKQPTHHEASMLTFALDTLVELGAIKPGTVLTIPDSVFENLVAISKFAQEGSMISLDPELESSFSEARLLREAALSLIANGEAEIKAFVKGETGFATSEQFVRRIIVPCLYYILGELGLKKLRESSSATPRAPQN